MNSFIKFAAVNTKIRVLESKFLSNEDFENLLNKNSVSQVASYLKSETHYTNILKDINENEIHRSQLEILIRKDHARQIEKIEHYFYDGYKVFFRYVFIKREIEELKGILRGIINGRISTLGRDSFAHLGRFSKVNIDSLLSSKSIEDFIKSLKGTIYSRYLEPLEDEKGEKSLFMAEMLLDLAYFDMFYKNLDDIGERDKKIVDELQGANIDLLNIQWVYRGLKYYNIYQGILFNFTIPHGMEFSLRDIKDLCYSKDLNDFEDKILNTRYKFLFDNENTKDIFMERRILRYQYFNIKKLENKHEMNISEAIAFDTLLEYEIRDIVTIIESIRYNMPPNEAKKFLIRKL